MLQFFSKPDKYFARCDDLRCSVTEHRISPAPAFLRGVRALFITDVHVRPESTDADLEALTNKAAALGADIVLLGGDYSDFRAHTLRLFEHFSRLSAPLGMYGVLGNNDRETFPDVEGLRSAMDRAGFALLVNESRSLGLNGGTLVVAGVDEYRRGHPDAGGLYPERASQDCYRLLLSHYPRAVKPMPDLMLCGHTHGGQFNFLGVTPYTIGFERLLTWRRAPRYIAGVHDCSGGKILVSKGIGASRKPCRIGVRPEINLITFD